jgi:hypothetical protein
MADAAADMLDMDACFANFLCGPADVYAAGIQSLLVAAFASRSSCSAASLSISSIFRFHRAKISSALSASDRESALLPALLLLLLIDDFFESSAELTIDRDDFFFLSFPSLTGLSFFLLFFFKD